MNLSQADADNEPELFCALVKRRRHVAAMLCKIICNQSPSKVVWQQMDALRQLGPQYLASGGRVDKENNVRTSHYSLESNNIRAYFLAEDNVVQFIQRAAY